MDQELENVDIYNLFLKRPGSMTRLQEATEKFKPPNGFSIRYLRYVLNPEDKRTNPNVIEAAEKLCLTLLKEIEKEQKATAKRRELAAKRRAKIAEGMKKISSEEAA